MNQCGLLLLIFKMLSLASSNQDWGYHECTYNTYRAVCLDQGPTLQRSDRQLTHFPAIADRGYTCVLLYNNKIAQFPASLKGTETIRTLNLRNNNISYLPDDLRTMKRLEILDLSRNAMTTLSRKTRFPGSLRGLLLASNGMKTIPEGTEIPGLFVFDLSNNLFDRVPEHFCVSDQLFRVDLTGNELSQDLSHSFDVLSRCRNIRKIPYCLFTDQDHLRCDCPTLAKVVAQKQTFCMGTTFRGREIRCNSTDSAQEYRNKYIFDVDVNKIKSSCSEELQSADTHDKSGQEKTTFQIVSFLLSLLSALLYKAWILSIQCPPMVTRT